MYKLIAWIVYHVFGRTSEPLYLREVTVVCFKLYKYTCARACVLYVLDNDTWAKRYSLRTYFLNFKLYARSSFRVALDLGKSAYVRHGVHCRRSTKRTVIEFDICIVQPEQTRSLRPAFRTARERITEFVAVFSKSRRHSVARTCVLHYSLEFPTSAGADGRRTFSVSRFPAPESTRVR